MRSSFLLHQLGLADSSFPTPMALHPDPHLSSMKISAKFTHLHHSYMVRTTRYCCTVYTVESCNPGSKRVRTISTHAANWRYRIAFSISTLQRMMAVSKDPTEHWRLSPQVYFSMEVISLVRSCPKQHLISPVVPISITESKVNTPYSIVHSAIGSLYGVLYTGY